MPFSLFVLVAIAFFFSKANSATLMLCWYGAAAATGFFSFLMLSLHRQALKCSDDYSYSQYQRWRLVVYLIALLWGGLYSSVALVFFPNANEIEIITVVIVLILNASIPSLTKGNDPWVYILFVVPVFCCFTWQIYYLEIEQYWLLTIMLPVACVCLIVFSLMTHKEQMEYTVLRILYKEAELKAVEATLDKTRFLAAASHDLRQPMQATQMYLQGALALPLSVQAEALIRKAKLASVDTNRLLDKLLNLSALDGEGMTASMRLSSLQPVIEKAIDQYRPVAQQKELFLNVKNMDVNGYFDELFLQQILQNLVSNAIKYTEQGGISVSAEQTEQHLVVSIKDTGIGISSADQKRIFDEFFQVQAEEEGQGLGLSIVKRLCSLQGIELTVTSCCEKNGDKREGAPWVTEFTLTLPLSSSK
ncbi:HAMP domain-containing histidine kinase [Marinomonas sp. A79]|uniref:histidine kinase n=1 Tax=Marinomonas vulgaris TaxID=2823372 RepID=A0ABS5HCD2_9GAMM|nr:HAMP domain-containing sensor histidine kinase [Marinomonas vulgaris]MBR7889127.1 HAMP domain-containing histidine kinase [Marinomonas vulgaris]